MPPSEIDHRPIPLHGPSWGLCGLVAGVVVGVVGALSARHAPPAAAPAPSTSVTTTQAASTASHDERAVSAVFVAPPFPGFATDRGSFPATGVESGRVDGSVWDLEQKVRQALAPCSAGMSVDESVEQRALGCATPGDESLVLLAPAPDGGTGSVRSYALEVKRRLVPGADEPPREAGSHSCDVGVRFLLAPDDAVMRGHRGNTGLVEAGQCGWYAPHPPREAFADAAARVFGADAPRGEHIKSGEVDRFRLWTYRDGVFWMVEALNTTSGAGSDVSVMRFDLVHPRRGIVGESEYVEAMRDSGMPCARELINFAAFNPGRSVGPWQEAAARCLYAVRGEPDAPARIAPVVHFVPPPPR